MDELSPEQDRELRAAERAARDGRGLPCYAWCAICLDIPGDDPCSRCPDCNSSLGAAFDSEW